MTALLLSHHPALQRSDYAGRPAYRIDVIKSLIQAAALPLAHLDPSHVGAGLLDLERVPTLLAARHLIGIPEHPVAWAMPASFPFSVCPA